MKQGTTPLLPFKIDIENNKIEKIIFTIGDIRKEYPENVIFENSVYFIPFTQNETLQLKGLIKCEAQINLQNNQVAKTEIKHIYVEETLFTELVDGGDTDGELKESIISLKTENVIIGVDGFSPIAKVEKSGNITTITITDINGTTQSQIYDGSSVVDQTFDGTSENAQSGIAISNELSNYVDNGSYDGMVAVIENKVDKVDGKGLSTNDFTDEDKNWVLSIQSIAGELWDKQDKPTLVTSGTDISLQDNTEYRLTNVTNLTLSYPQGNFECWLRLSFAETGDITVTLPTSQYIGSAPTFSNGETWEISIKDGVVIAQKVGA